MGGKTSAASHNKYNAKTYDRVALVLKKSGPANKSLVQAAADAAGESLNGYITGAIIQRIKKDSHLAE